MILENSPPYANYELHAGHILEQVYNSFILKNLNHFKHPTKCVCGIDVNGLPIIRSVLKKYPNLPEFQLKKKCEQLVTFYSKQIIDSFKKYRQSTEWKPNGKSNWKPIFL